MRGGEGEGNREGLGAMEWREASRGVINRGRRGGGSEGGVRMDVDSDGGVSASLLVTRLSFHLRGRRGSGCIASPPYQKRTNHPGDERRSGGRRGEGEEGRTDRELGKHRSFICFSKNQFTILSASSLQDLGLGDAAHKHTRQPV